MNANQRVQESVGAGISRRIVTQEELGAQRATAEVLSSLADKASKIGDVSWPTPREISRALGNQQLEMAQIVGEAAGELPSASRLKMAAEQIQCKGQTFLQAMAEPGSDRPASDAQR